RVNPSSNARIFAAVSVFANRSSAIAPTISCPSGPYASAAIANPTVRKLVSTVRRSPDFIFRTATIQLNRVFPRKFQRVSSSAVRIQADLVDTHLKFREVRSRPIDLAAAGATPELFVVNFRKRFELLNYLRLGHHLQRRMAADTSRKWRERTKEIKAVDYFDGLFVSILRTWAVAGPYYRVHE